MRLHALIVVAASIALECSPASTAHTTDAGSAGDDDAGPPPPPMVELGRHSVAVTDTRKVIPGPGLPTETKPLVSNNNLDVVSFKGRTYLAWRTGPNHYASTETAIYVVSTTDEKTWQFEKKLTASTDLRETRFLPVGDELFLYLSKLGNDPLRFQPQGLVYVKLKTDGTWTDLTDFYKPDYVLWRSKIERGKAYLLGYDHGEHEYDFTGLPMNIELLTTTDGVTLTGVDPAKPVISMGGGSETDFTLADDGTLFGVIRNEAGDATGLGSKVCRAAPGAMTKWTCKQDPKKYDSPLMFWYDGEAYLIGRRNVSPTGNFDVADHGEPVAQQDFDDEVAYKPLPKRCSLWRYVQSEDRIAYILDFPSRGDTCYAGLLHTSTEGQFVVYNYSSDIEGPIGAGAMDKTGRRSSIGMSFNSRRNDARVIAPVAPVAPAAAAQ